MLKVRRSTEKDLPAIRELYKKGVAHMREEGNTTQWNGEDYPFAKIPADITNGNSYVIIEESGKLCGTFAFILGKDPTYDRIEYGSWPDELPYGTIHRIVSDQETKGILATAVAFCDTQTDHLRIDTHADNKTMRAAVEKQGFLPAGIIYVDDGTPRLAFYRNIALSDRTKG